MAAEVLILGGGLAGLAAAGRLARRRGVRVRLVDRRCAGVFSPLLPDLISGLIRPEHVRLPLEAHCRRGVEFIRAEVHGIDADRREVATSAGDLRADWLILCLGCDSDFHGNEAMRVHALGLKEIEEALAIRRRAGRLVRDAAAGTPASILVVGGGYTGFEAASHAARLACGLLHRPPRDLPDRLRVRVLERGPLALGNVSPGVRDWALRATARSGVEVQTGLTVEGLESAGPGGRAARLSDGSVVPGAMVIWAAGVAPGPAVAKLNVPKVSRGRLAVEDCLRVRGKDRVFAAGDVAGAVPPGEDKPLRMGVQFSIAGGRRAAENVLRELDGRRVRPFAPRDPGYLIPLGPDLAAGIVLGRELRGRAAVALHYFMCVVRSGSWANRAGVLADLACGGASTDGPERPAASTG